MGEVRIFDLDDAMTPKEVAIAVAQMGNCSVEDVKVGEIRRTPTSLGTVWVKCPLATVKKLTVRARLLIGWSSARIEALENRPLRCFRCLEKGHVGQRCPNGVDQSYRCYTCGERDHRAKECNATSPKCSLCSDLGRSSAHRLGTKECCPTKNGKKKRDKGKDIPAAGTKTTEASALVQGLAPQEVMEVSPSQE